MIKVMTGSHKQNTGFVECFFSVTDLASEHQAAVTVLEEMIAVLLFESGHKVAGAHERTVTQVSGFVFVFCIILDSQLVMCTRLVNFRTKQFYFIASFIEINTKQPVFFPQCTS